jgi:monovalent cation:H+ antiporter-2, CPA2 family
MPLLTNVAVALGFALVGGLLVRLARVPPLVGYLLAGVAIGPFTPGFVGDSETIEELAELGVVFLMFGVGLHFSLRDLWAVRRVAVPGALVQMALTTALAYGLARYWGWPPGAALVLGLALSIASTVVLLRGLMDHALLDTSAGRIAVGWLVLEDLATVLLLLVLPLLAKPAGGAVLEQVLVTLARAAVFVGLMLVVGARLLPWLVGRIARTRSRELFLLLAVTLALGVALGAAVVFGVSLALGAFLAGVVVRESPMRHQIGADLLPFRDAFAVLFFVSVGMLVDPRALWSDIGPVLAISAVVVLGKAAFALGLTLLLRQPARTGLVVAAGLAQVGEFSFILGRAALALGILAPQHYSLILAAALISITVNPFAFRLVAPLERLLRRVRPELPAPGARPGIDAVEAPHVVVVGCGRVGHHVVDVLGRLGVPCLVVDLDAERVEALRRAGVPTLFGDAGNSEILQHAGLERARALVVTVGDAATASVVVATARELAPGLWTLARSSTAGGVRTLYGLGARTVIHPELEGGLEIVRHTLAHLGFPLREVQRYADAVRHDGYDAAPDQPGEQRALRELQAAAGNLEITWVRLREGSAVAGRTLAQANLRARTGSIVVAIRRDEQLVPSPSADTPLVPGDRLALIGSTEQVNAAEALLAEAAPDLSAGGAVDATRG